MDGRATGQILIGAVGALLVSLIIMGMVFWCDGIQYPRVRADKSTWIPFRTYSPETENALSLLAKVNRTQYEYVRRSGIPIQHLTAQEFPQSGCRGKGTYGCTSQATGTISINETEMGDTAYQAAIISREIIHVQHCDLSDAHSRHPRWWHVFVRHEEAEAHLTGNWTWVRLAYGRPLSLRDWSHMWVTVVGEFFFYFAPFTLVLLTGACIILLCYGLRKTVPVIFAKVRRPPPVRLDVKV